MLKNKNSNSITNLLVILFFNGVLNIINNNFFSMEMSSGEQTKIQINQYMDNLLALLDSLTLTSTNFDINNINKIKQDIHNLSTLFDSLTLRKSDIHHAFLQISGSINRIYEIYKLKSKFIIDQNIENILTRNILLSIITPREKEYKKNLYKNTFALEAFIKEINIFLEKSNKEINFICQEVQGIQQYIKILQENHIPLLLIEYPEYFKDNKAELEYLEGFLKNATNDTNKIIEITNEIIKKMNDIKENYIS